jgi:exodeoxyribonuclease V alpha subunit
VAPEPRSDASSTVTALGPFREAGVLESVELHVVDWLGALVGESRPDVLLALALAVRAPRFGHVCVDLGSLQLDELCGEPEAQPPTRLVALELPADRAAWLQRVAASALVVRPGGSDVTRPFVLDGTLLYTDRYYGYQQRLGEQLRARLAGLMVPTSPKLLQQGLQLLFPASAERGLGRQQLAAATALLRALAVISGGPGTGKTYAVRGVLTLLWAQWATERMPSAAAPGPRVALAAPTGKAALRLQQSLLSELESHLQLAAKALPSGRSAEQLAVFLTSLQPATIHRLLRWDPANPTRFGHHAQHPLPYDVVVVDEASMVDLALMAKLVDAVAVEARLLLIGDPHQLSSVEAGTVLADLCGSLPVAQPRLSRGFATRLDELAGLAEPLAQAELVAAPGPYDAMVRLDENRRFAPDSRIGRFARACVQSDAAAARELLCGLKRHPELALLSHRADGALGADAARILVDGYRPYLLELLAGGRDNETRAALHARVLLLFDRFRVLTAHRQGQLGVGAINQAACELLQGDRALARSGLRTRAEYWVGRPILVSSNDYTVRLFNGDVGIVVADERRERKVAFPDAGGVRYVAPARLPEHDDAFAMTIHKSQGSEFEHALVTLPERDSPVLSRELIYTAVTRARRRLTLVGDLAVLQRALGKSVRRASGLERELWEAGQPNRAGTRPPPAQSSPDAL